MPLFFLKRVKSNWKERGANCFMGIFKIVFIVMGVLLLLRMIDDMIDPVTYWVRDLKEKIHAVRRHKTFWQKKKEQKAEEQEIARLKMVFVCDAKKWERLCKSVRDLYEKRTTEVDRVLQNSPLHRVRMDELRAIRNTIEYAAGQWTDNITAGADAVKSGMPIYAKQCEAEAAKWYKELQFQFEKLNHFQTVRSGETPFPENDAFDENQYSEREYKRKRTKSGTKRDYFDGCHTKSEVRARYRILAKQYHPDNNGDPAIFQEITSQYNLFMESFG